MENNNCTSSINNYVEKIFEHLKDEILNLKVFKNIQPQPKIRCSYKKEYNPVFEQRGPVLSNGCISVCHDIGVADRSVIPDSSFTASSSYPYYENKPYFGRLRSSKQGWAPSSKGKVDSYLQVDLGRVYTLCSIKTQGSSIYNEWTKSYKLQLSVDGKNESWFYYGEKKGVDKVSLF